MDTLTKDVFEKWMRTIAGRLDRHEEMLLSMRKGDMGRKKEVPSMERLFDNQDLCLLLQISKRTLQRYRSEGALPYKTLGQKIYYTEDDLMDFLSTNIRHSRERNIEFYKTRIDNIINK